VRESADERRGVQVLHDRYAERHAFITSG